MCCLQVRGECPYSLSLYLWREGGNGGAKGEIRRLYYNGEGVQWVQVMFWFYTWKGKGFKSKYKDVMDQWSIGPSIGTL